MTSLSNGPTGPALTSGHPPAVQAGAPTHSPPGSHLVKGDQRRIWAYHDRVDLGGPAMARIARDYGYTAAELRKL